MGQFVKPVDVCASVHSRGHLSWSIFTEFSTEIITVKSKNKFVGESISHQPFPYFAQKTHFKTRVLKIHANINKPISAYNVYELPKFSRLAGNPSRATRR